MVAAWGGRIWSVVAQGGWIWPLAAQDGGIRSMAAQSENCGQLEVVVASCVGRRPGDGTTTSLSIELRQHMGRPDLTPARADPVTVATQRPDRAPVRVNSVSVALGSR
ncbi:hypothetical protein BDA96_01G291500 [Sorghum bicolor]|uniref:Uncharacterized protein n=2 Tax=Sorghum bicolor TaxID=4558 RepID=A0A921S0D8_SORBI|nr:hypothetical protein BDA96_01G291500 [Sorghum bicolor]KXG38734.1 hypothetical protein SORBI_3001G272400 [Sorghum bicolor]